MRLIRVLCLQLKRALINRAFWCSVILFLIAISVNCIAYFNEYSSVVYIIEMSAFSVDVLVLAILPCLAFSLSYSSERDAKALHFYYSRTGAAEYVFAKYLATAISGFCVVFFGYWIFVLVLSLIYPFSAGIVSLGSCYAQILEGGHPILYILTFVFNYSLSGSIFAGISMLTSTFTKEKYVSVVLPYIIYMLLLFVFEQIGVPRSFMPTRWMLSYMDLNTPAASLIAKLTITMAIHIICVSLSVRRAERSVLNA